MTKTRELHPQMTTARFSRWGAVILVLWAGQMPQLCRNPSAWDGLFLCLRSFLLKHENSRNKSRKEQYLEVLLAQNTLNISMSYGSMHIETVKMTPRIPGYWGLVCMKEGGSSPYYEVTQVLFVEMEIPGKSYWGYLSIEIGKVQAVYQANLLVWVYLMSSGCLSAAMLTASRYSNIWAHLGTGICC